MEYVHYFALSLLFVVAALTGAAGLKSVAEDVAVSLFLILVSIASFAGFLTLL